MYYTNRVMALEISHVCNTKQERLNKLTELIEADVNVFIYGTGNNGKTFIINQLKDLLVEHNYTHLTQVDNLTFLKSYELMDFLKDNQLVVECTKIPARELGQLMSDAGFIGIEFKGQYDEDANEYLDF